MDAARQTELLALAGKYLAGGGTGLFVLPPELNLVVERGKGSRVWDVAGREYIDYHLSSGPALLGHAHPAITEAVAAQLPKGTTYFFLNEPEIRLAQRLVDAVPCGGAPRAAQQRPAAPGRIELLRHRRRHRRYRPRYPAVRWRFVSCPCATWRAPD